jgi:hypothetical protein
MLCNEITQKKSVINTTWELLYHVSSHESGRSGGARYDIFTAQDLNSRFT